MGKEGLAGSVRATVRQFCATCFGSGRVLRSITNYAGAAVGAEVRRVSEGAGGS